MDTPEVKEVETVDSLKAKHAKEIALLNTKIQVLQHRYTDAENRFTDALVQLNLPKE